MEKGNLRPPIVVVVGHVDHGKTSLLDAIRKTVVTRREAGGITQSIGASVAKTSNGKDVTFIDTPGHALFHDMRSRGVILADIAILVVAADDGVQPQTKEVVKLLQESQLPFVVAITKIDLATANPDNVLQQLEKEGVYFEKRGGDVSYIGVSSKSGEGIKELLDLVSLLSEVNEIKGDSNGELDGYVIETSRDKRGLLVSAVIKNGKVKVGDIVFAGKVKAKVRGIFDDSLKPIKEIVSGYPGQILGFEELPKVGIRIASREIESKVEAPKANVKASEEKIKIFVKAKTAGSLEALLANIPAEVQVIGSGVGDLTETDIFLSKAAGAFIFLFEAKFNSAVRRLAETEGVIFQRFDVVYDLIEKLKEMAKEGHEVIVGSAQIVASFPFNSRKVAGSKILQGRILKGDKLKLLRGEKELGKVRVVTIRKQKEEVNEVRQGEECGILFEPQLDFKPGDVLLSVNKLGIAK